MTSAEPPGAPLVVVSQRLGALSSVEEELEAAGARLMSVPLWTVDEIHANAANAWVVILGAVEPMGREALAALPRLGAVVRRGVGVDNVDVEAATELGIVVANVPDASVDEVAEHALAMLLAIERQVPHLDRAVRDGAWARDPARIELVRAPIRRIGELTLGIVGLGRIGQALARRAGTIYHDVIAADPVATVDQALVFGARLVELDELVGSADHVSLHAPLTGATARLVRKETLAQMRHGVVIVNTARGGLVDEADLVAAIASGRVRGAGLDVTEREPLPAGSPLLTEQRVILTAHSAASSTTAQGQLRRRSVDAALAILAGRQPESIVNPEVLQSTELRAMRLRDA